MRALFIISLCLSLSNPSYSQSIFPEWNDNPKWKVYHNFWGMNTWTDTFQYSYDTTFCGYQYSLMKSFHFIGGWVNGYVRIDNDKAYARLSNNCSDQEFLMYDFSINVGDTIICGYEGGDSTQFWLTQIDTVNYFGIDRQRYRMLFNFGPPGFSFVTPMDWVKGIGSLWHPFYTLVCLNSSCESFYELICFDSAGTQLYQNPAFTVCDTTYYMSVDEYSNSDVVIFPNPFIDKINVSSDKYATRVPEIKLYTPQGKLIETLQDTHSDNTEVRSVQDLSSGIYFLKIIYGDNSYVHKIIKR